MTLYKLLRSTPLAGVLRPYWRALLARRRHARDVRRLREEFRASNAEDKRRIEFYRQFVHAGDTVYDVGANRGNRVKAFLALGASVVAFEPQKACGDYLETVLDSNRRFKLVRSALGEKEGSAEMLMSNYDVLSSIATDWIQATRSSGRFASVDWERKEIVPITTLDLMIARHGKPSFIKIDVEGYELEVLRGLSQPVNALSIEFTAETLQKSLDAIDHMASLGAFEGQFSFDESMEFALDAWQPTATLKQTLTDIATRHKLSVGDIYLRLRSQPV